MNDKLSKATLCYKAYESGINVFVDLGSPVMGAQWAGAERNLEVETFLSVLESAPGVNDVNLVLKLQGIS